MAVGSWVGQRWSTYIEKERTETLQYQAKSKSSTSTQVVKFDTPSFPELKIIVANEGCRDSASNCALDSYQKQTSGIATGTNRSPTWWTALQSDSSLEFQFTNARRIPFLELVFHRAASCVVQ